LDERLDPALEERCHLFDLIRDGRKVVSDGVEMFLSDPSLIMMWLSILGAAIFGPIPFLG
jgi:hypothetical protein